MSSSESGSHHGPDVFTRLQNWVISVCNGDWEHSDGVSIRMCDNPGWVFRVDMRDLPAPRRPFVDINRPGTDADWMFCRVQDGYFDASGDLLKLPVMLGHFLDWVEDADRPR